MALALAGIDLSAAFDVVDIKLLNIVMFDVSYLKKVCFAFNIRE